MTEFTCNVCGGKNQTAERTLDREQSTCSSCGSNVRTRGLLQALSSELFGVSLTLPDFPRVKSLRGLGTSDDNTYASRLTEKLDYRNTFFDREPRFNLCDPAGLEARAYDFIISSEVFEHVPPPVDNAFANIFRLLKPGGVLVFTVPYNLEGSMHEHFPDLHEYAFAEVGGKTILVNRTRTGEVQTFDNLIFHLSSGQPSLEMREFSEDALKAALTKAGFSNIRIYSATYLPFGIIRSEECSLPIAARKGTFSFSLDATREIAEEWRALQQKHTADMSRLCRSFWFRLGRKLRLF